jgi:hypothetical protein
LLFTGTGTGPGLKFCFLPGPGLKLFQAGPGKDFLSRIRLYIFHNFYFVLIRICQSAIFIYDFDKSLLLIKVLGTGIESFR